MVRWLTPALADANPGLAQVVPWLFLADGILIVGAKVVMHLIVNLQFRLTPEVVRSFKERGTAFALLEAQRWLIRTRYLLLAIAVVIGGSWAWLWGTGQVGSEWTEVVFVVIYAGVLFPLSITVRTLSLALASLMTRLERDA